MDLGSAGKLYSRIRGWIILAMIAFVVVYALFSLARDVLWPQPPATAPAAQPASGAVR